MSDLISRSALLQKFNDSGIQITFDLPVEEIIGEDVDIDDFAMLVQDAIQAYKNMVIGAIKDMPTAYDENAIIAYGAECYKKGKEEWIGKIVTKLDNAESVKVFGSLNSGNRLIPVSDAIDIVKGGAK
jgi:hypothetical protein